MLWQLHNFLTCNKTRLYDYMIVFFQQKSKILWIHIQTVKNYSCTIHMRLLLFFINLSSWKVVAQKNCNFIVCFEIKHIVWLHHFFPEVFIWGGERVNSPEPLDNFIDIPWSLWKIVFTYKNKCERSKPTRISIFRQRSVFTFSQS